MWQKMKCLLLTVLMVESAFLGWGLLLTALSATMLRAGSEMESLEISMKELVEKYFLGFLRFV